MRQIVNYFLLILTNIFSFLSIRSYDFYPKGPYNKSLDNYRLMAPGVLFSLYLIFLERQNWSFRKLILRFCLLLVLYFISLMSGSLGWGIAVPFVGALGALLIKQLFYPETELLDSHGMKKLVFGFVSGLVGLVFFYIVVNQNLTFGFGFGLILMSWQFVIGVMWIKNESTPKIN
jgi:hypothetical protein